MSKDVNKKTTITLNSDVQYVKLTTKQLEEYSEIQEQALAKGETIKLNDYIKRDSEFKNTNTIVVADFSGLTFDNKDFKGFDFSGCKFSDNKFTNCNLEGAVFCDTELNNTIFGPNNILTNIDLRGANIANVYFDKSYKDYSAQGKQDLIQGIKLSSTPTLIIQQGHIMSEDQKSETIEQLILAKDAEARTAYANVPYLHKYRTIDENTTKYEQLVNELDHLKDARDAKAFPKTLSNPEVPIKSSVMDPVTGFTNKFFTSKKGLEVLDEKVSKGTPDKIQKLREEAAKGSMSTDPVSTPEIEALEKDLTQDILVRENTIIPKQIPNRDIIDPSIENIFDINLNSFDPTYKKGSTKEERDKEKQLVRLSREDIIKYLDEIKTSPTLSLNDYAKAKFQKDNDLPLNITIVADCSATMDKNGAIIRPDFSDLDFANANLDGTNFAGAMFKGCNFDNTNMSNSNFQGADFGASRTKDDIKSLKQGAKQFDIHTHFNNIKANNSNFADTILKSSYIHNCEFKNANLSRSNLEEATIFGTDFSYASMQEANAYFSDMTKNKFNFANMNNIDLSDANILQCQTQYAVLDNAIIDGAVIRQCDLKHASTNKITAVSTTFKDTPLDHMNLAGSNFSYATIDMSCSVEGTNFQDSLMLNIKAQDVNFNKTNLDGVVAYKGNFTSSTFEGATARFAFLEETNFSNVRASGLDLTGSNAEGIKAGNADFSKVNLNGTDVENGDFTNTNLQQSNLQNTNAKLAKFEKAKFDQAKINVNTQLLKADINQAVGSVIDYDDQGKVIEDGVSIKQRKVVKDDVSTEQGKVVKDDVSTEQSKVVKSGMSIEQAQERNNQIDAANSASIITSWKTTMPEFLQTTAATGTELAINSVKPFVEPVIHSAIDASTAGTSKLVNFLGPKVIGDGIKYTVDGIRKVKQGLNYINENIIVTEEPIFDIDDALENFTNRTFNKREITQNSQTSAATILSSVIETANTAGVELETILKYALVGEETDKLVKDLTGKHIFELGDQAVQKINEQLQVVNNNINSLSPDQIQRQNKLRENIENYAPIQEALANIKAKEQSQQIQNSVNSTPTKNDLTQSLIDKGIDIGVGIGVPLTSEGLKAASSLAKPLVTYAANNRLNAVKDYVNEEKNKIEYYQTQLLIQSKKNCQKAYEKTEQDLKEQIAASGSLQNDSENTNKLVVFNNQANEQNLTIPSQEEKPRTRFNRLLNTPPTAEEVLKQKRNKQYDTLAAVENYKIIRKRDFTKAYRKMIILRNEMQNNIDNIIKQEGANNVSSTVDSSYERDQYLSAKEIGFPEGYINEVTDRVKQANGLEVAKVIHSKLKDAQSIEQDTDTLRSNILKVAYDNSKNSKEGNERMEQEDKKYFAAKEAGFPEEYINEVINKFQGTEGSKIIKSQLQAAQAGEKMMHSLAEQIISTTVNTLTINTPQHVQNETPLIGQVENMVKPAAASILSQTPNNDLGNVPASKAGSTQPRNTESTNIRQEELYRQEQIRFERHANDQSRNNKPLIEPVNNSVEQHTTAARKLSSQEELYHQEQMRFEKHANDQSRNNKPLIEPVNNSVEQHTTAAHKLSSQEELYRQEQIRFERHANDQYLKTPAAGFANAHINETTNSSNPVEQIKFSDKILSAFKHPNNDSHNTDKPSVTSTQNLELHSTEQEELYRQEQLMLERYEKDNYLKAKEAGFPNNYINEISNNVREVSGPNVAQLINSKLKNAQAKEKEVNLLYKKIMVILTKNKESEDKINVLKTEEDRFIEAKKTGFPDKYIEEIAKKIEKIEGTKSSVSIKSELKAAQLGEKMMHSLNGDIISAMTNNMEIKKPVAFKKEIGGRQ